MLCHSLAACRLLPRKKMEIEGDFVDVNRANRIT
jgi:hypothetical protein